MLPSLPVPLLSRVSTLLAARIGLHFPAERWGDLERGLAAAANAFGLLDARSCAQQLLSAPLGQREIGILASCLTIGETYFFRDPRCFEALEQHILPPLLRRRAQGERQLRIWSAACSTGEEPYSVAMLLDRMAPDAGNGHATLLATDINPAFLRKAAKAEYSEWSFRGTPEWVKARYFRPLPDGRHKLDERIRTRVRFSPLNLADDAYPSPTNNTHAMDVIFCRNVLMYFTAERARAVVENLGRALAEGGWLIVSPAETSSVLFAGFTTVEFEGAILYRKDAGATQPRYERPVSPQSAAPMPEPVPPAAAIQPHRLPAAEAPAGADETDRQACAQPENPSHRARELADQGRFGEAAEWCRQAIAADKLNPFHHYLMSAIQQEQGRLDDAAQTLARALFLDPGFVLAHYALGNLRQTQGRHREARRHFDNALAALRAYRADEPLPESDGLTAGRLMEIVETMRASAPPIPEPGHHP